MPGAPVDFLDEDDEELLLLALEEEGLAEDDGVDFLGEEDDGVGFFIMMLP